MNKLQTAYTIAKSQYEVARKEAFDYTAPYYDIEDISDEALEAVEIEAEEKFNIVELKDILKTAENALIEWAFAKVSKIAHIGEEMNAIKICYDNRSNPRYRQQFVDMAFKLA